MKKIFLIISFLIGANILLCQSITSLEQKFKQFTPVSPSSAKLMQEIDYPTDLSRGSVNLSIPMHTIETRDFTLPITLKCNTSGIKLGEHSGWIALGWTLDAEPLVTREKKGSEVDESGYIYYNSDFGSEDKHYTRYIAAGAGRDEQPDIFYFRTLTNSGKFIFKRPENINESRVYKPIYFPSTGSKVIVEDLKNGLTIMDANGTKYTYGNNLDSREYSIISGRNELTSWKATRIESLQNDIITFSYIPIYYNGAENPFASQYDFIAFEDQSTAESWTGYSGGLESIIHPISCGYWLGIDGKITNYYIPVEYKLILPNENIKYRIDEYKCHSPSSDHYKFYKIDVPVSYPKALQTIDYANGQVVFSTNNDCLEKISVYERGVLIKTVHFLYSVYDYPSQRRLDELIIVDNVTNKSQKYTFEYYGGPSPGYLQNPGKAMDYWGYYNGANNRHLVPPRTITVRPSKLTLNDWDAAYDAITTIGEADREPNIICQRQTLKSIIYPSGLKDEFIYELHEYNDPMTNKLKKAGGLRIQDIISYEKRGGTYSQVKKKTFRYRNGVIHNPPEENLYTHHYTKIYYYATNSKDFRRYRVYNSISSASLTNNMGTPVAYNYVEEIEENNSKKVYKYDYVTNYSFSIGEFLKNSVDYLIDWYSGRLKQQNIYDEAGTVVESMDMNYSGLYPDRGPLNETNSGYIYGATIIENYTGQPDWIVIDDEQYDRYIHTYKGNENRVVSDIIKKEYEKVYNNYPDSIVTHKKFKYGLTDNDIRTGFPIEVSMTNSNGAEIINKFKYPYHLNTVVSQKMVEKNDISNIMEENYINAINGNITARKDFIFDYSQFWGGALPYRLNSLKTNDVLTNALYDAEKYNIYDDQGNVTEYISKDGVIITLLWGYKYQKLIAEIRGVGYNTVVNALGISYYSLQDMGETALISFFNNFRSKRIGQVTSYTYYPSRGVSTVTTPSGITTFYEYDGFGRLLQIKDTDEKIIEQYDYHFKQ